MGYLLLLVIQMVFHLVEPFAQFTDIHRCQFGDVLVPDTIGESLTVESLSVTFRTFAFFQKLISPFLTRCRFVIFHDISQVFNDAVETDEIVAGGVNQFLFDPDIFKRTIEYFRHGLFRNVLDGCLQIKIVFL